MIFVSTFTKFFLEKKKYVYIFNKRDCLNNFKAEPKRKKPLVALAKALAIAECQGKFQWL